MGNGRFHNFLLEHGLLYVYGLFIAGYFLLPMAAGHRRLYYLLVVPVVLFLWRDLWGFFRDSRLLGLIIAYISWMSLTLFWTADYIRVQAIWQLYLSFTAVTFVTVSGFFWYQYRDRLDRLLRGLLWLAVAAATCSIVVFYLEHPFPSARLEPLGVMHHQNKAGAAYGLLLLLCTRVAMLEESPRQRGLYWAAAGVLAALVLLTQSRTALAAVCVGLAVLLGKRVIPWLMAGLVLSFALVASNPESWWERVTALSFRPGIWRQVLEDMQGHWLLGHGYLIDPHVTAYGRLFDHAHNGYLASLRDGGLVGLGLLCALLGTGVYQAATIALSRGERLYLALLLYGMTCIFMDFDRLLVHPKELWLFFWLPLALVAAVYPRRENDAVIPLQPAYRDG